MTNVIAYQTSSSCRRLGFAFLKHHDVTFKAIQLHFRAASSLFQGLAEDGRYP